MIEFLDDLSAEVTDHEAEERFDSGVSRRVTRVGLPDRYIECGAVATLQARYGLTTEALTATIAALD